MNQPFAIRGHNNVQDTIEHPGLRHIIRALTKALTQSNEPFRVRYQRNEGSETVKVFTLATDNQLYFSVLDHRQDNVHAKFRRFRTVFQDEQRAGWNTPRVCDYKTNIQRDFSSASMKLMINAWMDWLALNAENARTPRTLFLVEDNVCVAPSDYIAGSFTIDKVQVSVGSDLNIKLSDSTATNQITISGASASRLSEPTRVVGCRVVVHKSGAVRILRETKFRQLYETLASKRKESKACVT